MDGNRFMQLCDFVRYDNFRMAMMLGIEVTEVEAFCLGTEQIPDELAQEVESFADWVCELSHTETKRELAKKYLNGSA